LGITINSIAPGAIETPINSKLLNDPTKLNSLLGQIPLARLGKPKDVASVAVFLASDDADYVTGSTYYVDGGLTWFYQEQ
jgi:glucose 1-dehydrogenase